MSDRPTSIEFTDVTQDSEIPVGVPLLAQERDSHYRTEFKGGDPLEPLNWKHCGNIKVGRPDVVAVI